MATSPCVYQENVCGRGRGLNCGLPLVTLFLQETNQPLLSPINETNGIDSKWQVIDTGREESPSTGPPLTSMLREKLGTNMRSAVTSTVIAFQSAEKKHAAGFLL